MSAKRPITTEDIIALRDEAGSAGDLEMVGICDRALWGPTGILRAWALCAAVIEEARNRAAEDG